MFFLYLLKSVNFPKTYTGITDNPNRRLEEHNSGKTIFTNRFKPWKIIYSEQFSTRQEAAKREKYLKSCAGRKWIKKNIFKN